MSHEMELEDFIVDLKRKVAVVEEQNQALREQLQWGRSFSAAEIDRHHRQTGATELASMGPQSFSCGDRAQGPPLSTSLTCFNGAAAFQLRRCSTASPPGPRSTCFNGAAAFYCGYSERQNSLTECLTCFNEAAALSCGDAMDQACMQHNFWLQ